VPPGDPKTGAPPVSPYLGLDHIGARVSGIDAAVAELKAKGAEFTIGADHAPAGACASPSCVGRSR